MSPAPGDHMLERTWDASQELRSILHSTVPPLTPQTTMSELARLVTLVSYTAQVVGRVAPALRHGVADLDLYLDQGGAEWGTADQAVAGALGHMALARDSLERAVVQLQAAESRVTWVGYHGPNRDEPEEDGGADAPEGHGV